MENHLPSAKPLLEKNIKNKNLIDFLKEDIDILKEIDHNINEIEEVELELRKITKNEKKIF